MHCIEYIYIIYLQSQIKFIHKPDFYRNENRDRNCVQISDTSSVVFHILLGHKVAVYDALFVFVVAVSYHLFLHLFRLTGCQRTSASLAEISFCREVHTKHAVCAVDKPRVLKQTTSHRLCYVTHAKFKNCPLAGS